MWDSKCRERTEDESKGMDLTINKQKREIENGEGYLRGVAGNVI